MLETVQTVPETLVQDREGDAQWHVLWTRSHCERLVHDQLAAKDLDVWLPEIDIWSRRGGTRRRARVPLFPGYLFLHHPMDKTTYLAIRQARGVVRPLGERWDRLAAVPDREIDAVKAMVGGELPAFPYPYLREGQRVRITRGPLTDVEGILVRSKPNRGLFVVSINLLRRSAAVEVDCTIVAPI